MQKGELRTKILDECPDDFREVLECWINDVEHLLHGTLDHFDIDGVDDLHKIGDAKRAIEDIHGGLY